MGSEEGVALNLALHPSSVGPYRRHFSEEVKGNPRTSWDFLGAGGRNFLDRLVAPEARQASFGSYTAARKKVATPNK